MNQEHIKVTENLLVDVDEKLAPAAEAALDKKAIRLTALDLRKITSVADAFFICSGTSSRQVQAIADAIIDKLRAEGSRPMHVEGYDVAEWILIDYGHLIVHIFSERAREFYDLERLWRDAVRLEIHDT